MGNTLIEDKGRVNLMKGFDTYVEQNPELGVRNQCFFENKLFKTLSFKSHQMNLIIKVHLMRKQISMSELYIHEQNLNYLWQTIGNRKCPNLLPFHKMINFTEGRLQKFNLTDAQLDCGKDYLAVARQQLSLTLEERLQTNYKLPKCLLNFITLQLLNAVLTLHSKKLYHGHIRTSNVLLTSADHIMLSDFASYKPYYIREDQLGDFRNLFQALDQKCYIAPEKFVSPTEPIESIIDMSELVNKKLLIQLQGMDMFSVGCVIAEIYTGENVFSLEQLIQYRKGEFDPNVVLNKIENEKILKIVQNLLQIDSSLRYNAQQAFTAFYELLNPQYELMYYLSVAFNWSVHFMQPDIRIGVIRKLFPLIDHSNKKQFQQALPIPIQKMNLIKFIQLVKDTQFPMKTFTIEEHQNKFSQTFQSQETQLIEEPFENLQNLRIREFKECIQQFQNGTEREITELRDKLSMSQVQRLRESVRSLNKGESLTQSERRKYQNLTIIQESVHHQQEILLLINMIFNQIRNARFMQSRMCGLELIETLLKSQDDMIKYLFILPQLCYLFDDTEFQVQSYAFQLFLNLLKSIKAPFPTNKEVQLFKLYIWEQIQKLIRLDDPNTNKLIATHSSLIAEILSNYRQHLIVFATLHSDPLQIPNFHKEFLDILMLKLTDNKQVEMQTLILQNIGEILSFYDPNETEQHLLILISAFNNSDLRIPLLSNLFKVYIKLGQNPKNSNIFLMLIDFTIRNELYLFHTVKFLRQIVQEQLFTLQQEKLYLHKIAPLMLFSNQWIKSEALQYVNILLQNHTTIEIFLHFQPILAKYIRQDISYITQETLAMLLPPQFHHKQWYDFANNKIFDILLPDTITQRDKQIFENYVQNFLRLTRVPVEKDDKVEKNIYDQKLQRIFSRTEIQVNLGQKVNELIIFAFKSGLLQFVLGEENSKKLDEYQYHSAVRQIDLKQDTLSFKKLKYLQEYLLQLTYSSNQDYLSVLSTTQHRNFINSMLIIQSIEMKTRQIQFKEELPLIKPTPYTNQFKNFKVQGNLVTTITEHKDIVSAIQPFKDQKMFISGSHDGTIKFYDLQKIEQDFTYGSVLTLKLQDGGAFDKVTALKSIEGSENFVVGTNNGYVSLYKGDTQVSTFKKADSEIIKIESLKNELSDSVLVYVTNTGNLSVEDTRCKNAMKFQVGKQRGMVTTMVQKSNAMSTIIGTFNGYLMVYDLRCNLIANVFQLVNHDEQPLPIFSISNFNRVATLEGVMQNDLIGLGYQSNNNEIGFWDLNELNENLNPAVFLSCCDKKGSIISTPRLKNLYKNEQFTNYSNNLHERCYYDFVGSYQQMDLLSYLKDPLTSSQRQIKEKWLKQTKNVYTNLKAAFEAKSSVTSLITLNNKNENIIISANTDRTVQSWTLLNDSNKAGDRNFEKEGITNTITSPYSQQRRFIQCKSGDVYVIQDYELKQQQQQQQQQNQVKTTEYKIEHKDCITDMTYMDRDISLLITSSRDYTIKIWK